MHRAHSAALGNVAYVLVPSLHASYAAPLHVLCAGDIEVRHEQGLVCVDGWARFKAPARIAVLVRELRAEVARLLARKIEQPALDVASSRVVEAMHHLLASDGF